MQKYSKNVKKSGKNKKKFNFPYGAPRFTGTPLRPRGVSPWLAVEDGHKKFVTRGGGGGWWSPPPGVEDAGGEGGDGGPGGGGVPPPGQGGYPPLVGRGKRPKFEKNQQKHPKLPSNPYG